jgi:hypothetical protein
MMYKFIHLRLCILHYSTAWGCSAYLNLIGHGHVRKWNDALKLPPVDCCGISRRNGPCCAEWKQVMFRRTRTCTAELICWGNTCRYVKQADGNLDVTHNVTQYNWRYCLCRKMGLTATPNKHMRQWFSLLKATFNRLLLCLPNGAP